MQNAVGGQFLFFFSAFPHLEDKFNFPLPILCCTQLDLAFLLKTMSHFHKQGLSKVPDSYYNNNKYRKSPKLNELKTFRCSAKRGVEGSQSLEKSLDCSGLGYFIFKIRIIGI